MKFKIWFIAATLVLSIISTFISSSEADNGKKTETTPESSKKTNSSI